MVFDVNLADTQVDTGSCRTRDLGLDDWTIFAALFFDVFLDFCIQLASCSFGTVRKHTIVFIVVNQLVRCHHVHETNDAAVLVVLSCTGTSQHGDGTDSAVEAGRLLQTNCGTRDLEVAIAERDIVQAFDDSVNDLIVGVLAECDTLRIC